LSHILQPGHGWQVTDAVHTIETTRIHHVSRQSRGLIAAGGARAATGRSEIWLIGDRDAIVEQVLVVWGSMLSKKYFSADGPTFSAPPVHLMRAEVRNTSTDQKATTGLRTFPTRLAEAPSLR